MSAEKIVFPLEQLTRRGFCRLAASCAAVGLAACVAPDSGLVGTGPLTGAPDAGHGGGSPDAKPGSPDAKPGAVDAKPGSPDAKPGPPDAAADAKPGAPDAPPGTPDAPSPDAPPPDAPSPDAPAGPTCGTAAYDVGAPSAFASGTATLFSTRKIIVARDGSGLYAMSAACTHRGTTLQVRSSLLHCSSHGADFDLWGGIVDGPITRPLQHYAMCVLAGGHVAVDTTQPVDAGVRLPL